MTVLGIKDGHFPFNQKYPHFAFFPRVYGQHDGQRDERPDAKVGSASDSFCNTAIEPDRWTRRAVTHDRKLGNEITVCVAEPADDSE